MPLEEELARALHKWLEWRTPFDECDERQKGQFYKGACMMLAIMSKYFLPKGIT